MMEPKEYPENLDRIREEYPIKINADSMEEIPNKVKISCPRVRCAGDSELQKATQIAPSDYSCPFCGFYVDIKNRSGEWFAEVSDSYK